MINKIVMPTWRDNQTPVNASNLNAMVQGINQKGTDIEALSEAMALLNNSKLDKIVLTGSKLKFYANDVEKYSINLPTGEGGGIPGADGEDGREIELRKGTSHLEWRYVGDTNWTQLVSLDELRGRDGRDGITPNISVGIVETLAPGSQATVTKTGTAEAPILNFGIPEGRPGSGEGGSIDPSEYQTKTDETLTTKDKRIVGAINEVASDTSQSKSGFKGNWSIWEEFELREINIRWFGAVADANYFNPEDNKYYKDAEFTIECTDNQKAFQDAVDFLNAKGGGTIYVPDGKYCFKSGVKWKSGVSMRGQSRGSTIFLAQGVIFNLFYNIDAPADGSGTNADFLNDCQFENFQCDLIGLTETQASVSGKAFFILYMRRARFHNLYLKNTIGTALGCDFLDDTVISDVITYRAGRNSINTGGYGGNSGIGIGTCSLTEEPVIVINCHTYNSGNYGVFVETQHNPTGYMARYAKVVNCYSEGNKLGFGNKGSGGTQFIGCTAFKNKSHGFHLTQGSSDDFISDCITEENGGSGIQVENDYVGNVKIFNNALNKNLESGLKVRKSIATINNIMVASIEACENGHAGIWIEGNANNVKISGSDTRGNGQSPTIDGKYKRGIIFTGVNTNVSVCDCSASDSQETKTQTAGIELSATTTNFIIEGNSVYGYDGANAYQIKSTDGIIGKNIGLVNEVVGEVEFAEGAAATYINHFYGQAPKVINLTLMGDGNCFVADTSEKKIG